MLGFGGYFVCVIITCQLVYLGFVCIIKFFLVDEIYSSATNVMHYECICKLYFPSLSSIILHNFYTQLILPGKWEIVEAIY